MSTDDIVFDEVTYREPERKCRPDRDRRWACLAYEIPGPDDLPIFLDRRTADAIERHALRDTTVELGGILLGKECLDDQTGQPFVWVTQALEAKHFENTQASFTYTHDSWEEISRERDRLHPDLDIVGWYHTHPDFGIFLSSHDLFIHHHFFAQPLQVAYVVDPIRQTRGFFRWRDEALEQVGGYHLVADRGDRIALARLVNDLEQIPNAEGGGGGLSPRLEAELIAMLTRPHQTISGDRTQTAAVFSLLGAVAGVLGLAALFWLNSLGHELRSQTETLASLNATLKKEKVVDDLEAVKARVEGKEAALDALLGHVHAGSSPETFTEQFTLARIQRDEALRTLEKQKAANDAIENWLVRLKVENKKMGDELADAKETAAKYEKDAKDVDDLRKDLDEKTNQVDRQSRELAEKKDEIQNIKDARSGVLIRKYQRAWWAAASGWVVSLILGLGVVTILARNLPDEEKPTASDSESPTHTIT